MSTSPPREHENRKILGISPAPATNFCRADPIRESPGSTRGSKAPERPPLPLRIAPRRQKMKPMACHHKKELR